MILENGTVWEETQLCYSPFSLKFSLKLFFLRKTWQQNNIFKLLSWHDWNVWMWALLRYVLQPERCAASAMPLSTSWARGVHFLCTWEPWYFSVWKQFRVVNDADLLIKTPDGWRTHTHWPLLQPWECCSSLKWLSRVAPTAWVLCEYWWGYCASEQSTFLICTFQREGRNHLLFNRAFRHPFQITTVVSFSYADFKLKVNEN